MREALLNVLFEQWSRIGAPAWQAAALRVESVVDPEALIRASIERLDDEPRLADLLGSWLRRHRTSVIRSRLVTSLPTDPIARTRIEQLHRELGGGRRDARAEPSGDAAPGAAWNRVLSIFRDGPEASRASGPVGAGWAGAVIRARLILGSDTRHLIIVHLLAAETARPSDVGQWGGFGQRAVGGAFNRLVEGGAVVDHHGSWRLARPGAWRQLLEIDSDSDACTLVDWAQAFGVVNELIATLSRARDVGLDQSAGAVTARVTKAASALQDSVIAPIGHIPPELASVRNAVVGSSLDE